VAITTYTNLQTEIANWLHRDDLTDEIPDFIALCEATLQVRCKLVEFESTATVTITSGVGTLPTGFVGMRSVYWNDSLAQPLQYITPEQFDAMRSWGDGDTYFYTISGSTIRTSNTETGGVIMTYYAKFVPLSGSNTSNAILSNFPDAYLYGSLVQACIYTQDDAGAAKYSSLFSNAIDRINDNNADRKYAGATLQVRAA
jgi:hypothetical protein